VEATCDQSIWLSDAVMRASGPTKEVMALYRSAVQKQATLVSTQGAVTVLKTEVEAVDGDQLRTEGEFEVRLTLHAAEAEDVMFLIGISLGTGFPVFVVDHHGPMPSGIFEVKCRMKSLPLPRGHYSVWAGITGYPEGRRDPLLAWQPLHTFDAFGPERVKPPQGVMVRTPVYVGSTWKVG
jgi:ABC-2 type transport system ATP-binding protein